MNASCEAAIRDGEWDRAYILFDEWAGVTHAGCVRLLQATYARSRIERETDGVVAFVEQLVGVSPGVGTATVPLGRPFGSGPLILGFVGLGFTATVLALLDADTTYSGRTVLRGLHVAAAAGDDTMFAILLGYDVPADLAHDDHLLLNNVLRPPWAAARMLLNDPRLYATEQPHTVLTHLVWRGTPDLIPVALAHADPAERAAVAIRAALDEGNDAALESLLTDTRTYRAFYEYDLFSEYRTPAPFVRAHLAQPDAVAAQHEPELPRTPLGSCLLSYFSAADRREQRPRPVVLPR